MESTVVIKDLSIGYVKKVVADNINASIQQGELTCLLGANGVGKSTLLKTLSGFLGKLGGKFPSWERNWIHILQKNFQQYWVLSSPTNVT